MRPYAERREARIARLQARADRARREGESRIAGAKRIADGIPFGQPILVGHHSEGRHRRDIKRIQNGFDKGFAKLKQADELERRAAAAEANTAISSDDPDAIAKLEAKLAVEESELAAIKAANAILRRGGPIADAAATLTSWKDPVRRIEIWQSMGNRTIPTTNSTAAIRATKARIAGLKARAEKPEREPETFGAIRIEESENRVRIYFPGKPTEETRKELKSHGFRWSPSEGAWQRTATDSAWYAARRIASRTS